MTRISIIKSYCLAMFLVWITLFVTPFTFIVLADEQAQEQAQPQTQYDQYHVDAGEGVKVFTNKAEADAYGKQAFERFIQRETQKAKEGHYAVDINGVRYGDPNAIKFHENLDKNTYIRPDGQKEYFPDDRETVLREHREFLEKQKKELQKVKEDMRKGVDENDPRQKEVDKAIDDHIKKVEEEGEKREQEIKESVKYEVPKVLTSTEKNKE